MARKPKGVVEASLVPASQEVGSVLRPELKTGLEGIEVISLSEVKPTRSPEKAGRIEVVGTPKRAPTSPASRPGLREAQPST